MWLLIYCAVGIALGVGAYLQQDDYSILSLLFGSWLVVSLFVARAHYERWKRTPKA